MAPSTFGMIDKLTYSFGDATRPDRLTDVQDAESATRGFKDATSPGTNYTYDLNENLTQDNNKALTLNYNHLNLPNSINNPALSYITMTYTDDGEKLTKVSPAGSRNYVAGIEYLGANTEAIYHAEGRCTPNGASAFHYEYTLKDHLGNARVNFRANGGAVTYLEDFHYYPFGMQMEGIGAVSATGIDYRYNGKELNEDLGLNLSDYGARWYDPAVGRFTTLDPLSSSLPRWSGYHFSFNNPLLYNDPTGLAPEKTLEELIQEAWKQTPAGGNATFNGNGDCECGCEGAPPCDKKGTEATIIEASQEILGGWINSWKDLGANRLWLPMAQLTANKKYNEFIREKLEEIGIDASGLSDTELTKIFGLRQVGGEVIVEMNPSGLEELIRLGTDQLLVISAPLGRSWGLTAKIPGVANATISQLNTLARKGKLGTFHRFDPPDGINTFYEHAHFWDGRALSSNGIWRHGDPRPLLTAEKKFLKARGYTLPE